jgi:hypothetical protein
MRLFLVLIFTVGTLEPVCASEAKELTRQERQALVVVRQDHISPEKTILYYGPKTGVLSEQKFVGKCIVTNGYADVTTRHVKAEAEVKSLGKLGAQIDQADSIVEVGKVTQEISKLADLLSAICIQYWQGDLDTPDYLRLNVILTRAVARQIGGLPTRSDEQILVIDSPAKFYKPKPPAANKTVVQGTTDLTKLIPSGVTNADFIYTHLRLTGIKERILTTTASPMWTRTDDIAADPPKLIILHFSAFESEGVYADCSPESNDLKNHCGYELYNFVGELLNPDYSPIPKTDRGRCFGVQDDSQQPSHKSVIILKQAHQVVLALYQQVTWPSSGTMRPHSPRRLTASSSP